MPQQVSQFKALLMKNVLQISRRKKNLLFFILGPMVSLILVGILNAAISTGGATSYSPEYTEPAVFDPSTRQPMRNPPNFIPLMFAPDTPETVDIMKRVAQRANLEYGVQVQPRPDALTMALEIGNAQGGRTDYGIIFTSYGQKEQNGQYAFYFWYNQSSTWMYRNSGRDNLYDYQSISGRSLGLQQLINEAILDSNGVTNPRHLKYNIKSFPMVGGDSSNSVSTGTPPSAISTAFGGVFYLCGVLVIFMAMVSTLMEEKTSLIKTKLQVMGLKEGVYIGSWILSEMLKGVVSVLLLVTIAHFTKLSFFSRTDFGVLFLLYALFVLSLLALSFLIASLAQKSLAANMVATVVFGLSLILEVVIDSLSFATYVGGTPAVYSSFYWAMTANTPGFVKFLLYSFPPFNFCAAVNCIQYVTADSWSNSQLFLGVPFKLADLSRKVNPDYDVTIGLLFGNLAWNAAAYLFLAWYFGQVFASQSGTSKPFTFLFQPEYWRGAGGRRGAGGQSSEAHSGDTLAHKQEQSANEGSIILHKVSKVFKDKSALKELSLNITSGQVFCLLGHNGAGKTTTMNILTGVHMPTHGAAFMFGNDIGTSMDILRDDIGMCEQEDILWPDLSGWEHLTFFLRFRGVPEADIPERVRQSLDDVKLLEAKDQFAGTYSGGMKRRLAVAISCSFHPRVLFLDEPTTGMDPVSKRFVWNKIQAFKRDRIVVLTTHSMEEADVLGDEIAILAEGRLRALGNSLFLKNHFGGGYRLHFICANGASQKVVDCVQQQSPKAEVVDHVGDDVTLRVPRGDRIHIPAIFRLLQQLLEDIRDWGISNTTLEEVFLRLAVQTKEVNAGGEVDQSLEEQVQHLQTSVRAAETQATKAQDLLSSLRRLQLEQAGNPQAAQRARAEIAEQMRQAEQAIEELLRQLNRALFPAPPPPLAITEGGAAAPQLEQQPQPGLAAADLQTKHSYQHVVDVTSADEAVPFYPNGNGKGSPAAGFPGEQTQLLHAPPEQVGLGAQVYGLCMYKSLPRLGRQKKTNKCIVFFMFCILLVLFILGRVFKTVGGGNNNSCWYSSNNFLNCTAEGFADQLLRYNPNVPRLPYYYTSGPYQNTSAWIPSSVADTLTSRLLVKESWSTVGQVGVVWGNQFATAQDMSSHVTATQTAFQNNGTMPMSPSSDAAVALMQSYYAYFAMDPKLTDGTNQLDTDLYFFLRPRYYYGGNVWKWASFPYSTGSVVTPGCVYTSGTCWNLQETDVSSITNAVADSLLREATSGNKTIQYGGWVSFPYVYFSGVIDGLVPTVCALLPVGTMLLLPIFVAEIAEDHSTKSLELMRMMGLRLTSYWVGVWVFQMLFHLAMTLVFTFLMFFFGVVDSFVKMGLLIFAWGHAEVGLAVLFSAVIHRPKAALVFSFIFINLFGPACGNIVYLVRSNSASGVLPWGTLAIAPLAYVNGIFEIMSTSGGPEFGKSVLALLLDGTVYFLLGALIHWFVFGNGLLAIRQWTQSHSRRGGTVHLQGAHESEPRLDLTGEDSDVEEMRQAVKGEELHGTKKPLVVRDLVKRFPRRAGDGNTGKGGQFLAVDRVSLQVMPGECFGLLGPNGAGKTTTISMITGHLTPTSGSIAVGGFVMDDQPELIHSVLGVCPQENILWPDLSCREHLALYARLKGVQQRDLVGVVQQVAEITRLDGDEFHQPAGQLSGGMKRRLCIGIALVGDPKVVLLDEPTTGLDPETRRMVWKIVNSVKQRRCVLLTTHSMEEADALCSRIGIMTHGRFRCVGTQFHLKNKFGSGYKLTVTVRAAAQCAGTALQWEELLRQQCPSLTNISALGNTRAYNIQSSEVDVGKLFALMEGTEAKEALSDWGITQCSLDDVFVRIAGPADA